MKFTKRLKLVQDKIGSIINELYWAYECSQGSVFEFEYNGEIYRPIKDDWWTYSDNGVWYDAKIDYTITNESLYVIGYLFEYFEYNQLYEIFSDLEDFLDKEYHVKELDLDRVGDGILEIREGIEKKFPGAKFTNDADAMIKGLQSIQRILDSTISKYVVWMIKEA